MTFMFSGFQDPEALQEEDKKTASLCIESMIRNVKEKHDQGHDLVKADILIHLAALKCAKERS